MTNGEALNIISERHCGIGAYCKNDCVDRQDVCNDCPYDVAIKAIEKQIPLVPVGDRKFARCKCGRLVNHYSYCPDCGQKFLKVGKQK